MGKDRHDLGLLEDLKQIEKQLLSRRQAMSLVALGGGAVLVQSCSSGGGSGASTTASAGSSTSTGSGTSTGTGSSSGSGSSSSGGTTSSECVVPDSETAGPYPGDGSNSSSGVSSNVLTESGVIRRDIRTSFINSTTEAEGVQLEITLTLVDANNSCAPLVGYAVYLWHATKEGEYSLYDLPSESYLRGVQVTDENGQLTFTTIVPGCYDGRYPHMHFEVFENIDSATNGSKAVLTSQLAIPEDVCTYVYSGGYGYSTSLNNFNRVSISSDNVFGDNTDAEMDVMTPTFTRSTSFDGYEAESTIGIDT